MRRNKPQPVLQRLTISDIGAEGRSIARTNEMVVFTDFGIPGDIVDLQVTKKKKRYVEARIIQYHEWSELRTEPFCIHFGLCGGCKWQNLRYPDQLHYKQKQVVDQLSRIGKIDLPEVDTIIGSGKTTGYRNKLEFTFSSNRWLTAEELSSGEPIDNRNALGFHIPGMFDKVFPVEQCWLQPEPSNKIRNFISAYAQQHGIPFFDIRKQEGFLRTLIIRTSTTGEVMVIITFFREEREIREKLLLAVKENFPEITSLMYVINSKGNDTINDQEVVLFSGNDHIWEEMENLRFKIGPKSFYQTNSEQAFQLYKTAREFAGLKGHETVYDLYTGTGTIANFIAGHCKKVVGIEYVPEAIDDARFNSSVNGIGNTSFFSGDMKNILSPNFFQEHGWPEVIVTDPPRAGMHEEVVKTIMAAAPEKIVYVSCNPATQARDILLMSDQYGVEKIQPVDMFPHTYHVENVVLLIKKQTPADL